MKRDRVVTRVRKAGTAIAAVPALFLAFAAGPAAAGVGDEIEAVAIDTGIGIASDPAAFLFDLHLTSEDRSPLPIGKGWQIGLPVFPTLLPFANIGLNGKGQVKREHGGWPQIDVMLGGWDSIPLMSTSSEDFEGALYGYNIGFIVAKSVDPRMRLFGGYEYTRMVADMKLDLDDDAAVTDPTDIGSFDDFKSSLDNIVAARSEHFVFAGAELLRTAKKRFVAEMGYGFVENKILMRMTWSGSVWDMGLAFYPESSWILWPFMNFHVRF